MSFTSWSFAALLLATALLHAAVPARWRSSVLLLASAAFFARSGVRGLAVVAALVAATAAIARPVARGSRTWLVAGVASLVAVLAYFKYVPLLSDALAAAAGLLGREASGWRLAAPAAPLGISFSTFLLIHFLVETYRGGAALGPVRLASFVAFFPTAISGPIRRVGEFVPQLDRAPRPRAEDVHEGLRRIVVGLARKVLADNLAPVGAAVLLRSDLGRASWGGLWLAVYAYSLQIYFDFGGYSDMAIGSARLLGYSVPENFDYPYLRRNVSEFWRAWHITLTSWIASYVYIPLGGNRRGQPRAHANRLIAMGLCGLWHGAAGHFALWGLYHGALLNLYHLWARLRFRLLGRDRRDPGSRLGRSLGTLLTFHLVALGWVLFVCDADRALRLLGRLLLVGGGTP